MNEQQRSLLNAWKPINRMDHFDVRVRVSSAISTLPQSIGPENVKEAYHLSDTRMETMDKPEVTEYSVDGTVTVYENCVVLLYPEPAVTGLGKCETRIVYWPDRPTLLELNRTGASAVHCLFDLDDPRQSVTFQTMFGSFEPILTLKGLINLMDYGIGKLSLAYNVDFPNIFTEHIELLISTRRLRPAECKSKSDAPSLSEEQLSKASDALSRANDFAYSSEDKEQRS